MKRALENYSRAVSGKSGPRFKSADLDEKTRKTFMILKRCELCERKCRADRTGGERGWCKVPDRMLVSSMFPHWGEERFLVPSFTVFFWSCTFSCVYCQNWTVSQRLEMPTEITEKELAARIDSCGCKNVNFVGGEPTPYLPFILKTLKFVKSDIPVIWNSNFYMSEKSMGLLKGIVDLYLSDFKYGNNRCAWRLSRTKRYTEVVKRNHILAFQDSDLVVRHLVLPGHTECCSKPVLDFISESFGRKVIVNIMPQYRPEYRAREFPDISGGLREDEFEEVVDYAKSLGLNSTEHSNQREI